MIWNSFDWRKHDCQERYKGTHDFSAGNVGTANVQDIVLRAIANPTLYLSQDYKFKFSAWFWKAHKNDLRQRLQEKYLRNKDIGRDCTFHNLNGNGQ